jgi:ABC-type branched-subunit amino acid transport system substrate-binding protein
MTIKLKQMMTRLALATAVTSAAATPALAQEVKIGVVLSNTGTFAFVGAPVINGPVAFITRIR